VGADRSEDLKQHLRPASCVEIRARPQGHFTCWCAFLVILVAWAGLVVVMGSWGRGTPARVPLWPATFESATAGPVTITGYGAVLIDAP
jgi:hypothetical protein